MANTHVTIYKQNLKHIENYCCSHNLKINHTYPSDDGSKINIEIIGEHDDLLAFQIFAGILFRRERVKQYKREHPYNGL